MKESATGMVLEFEGQEGMDFLKTSFADFLNDYISWIKNYNPSEVNKKVFEEYSAKKVTEKLVNLLNSLSD
jgi:hypothetical protein